MCRTAVEFLMEVPVDIGKQAQFHIGIQLKNILIYENNQYENNQKERV